MLPPIFYGRSEPLHTDDELTDRRRWVRIRVAVLVASAALSGWGLIHLYEFARWGWCGLWERIANGGA